MKKFLLLLLAFSGMIFALTDTDADGVSDDKDVCPRVYARSENGCPSLAPASKIVPANACLLDQMNAGKMIATLLPVCDKNTSTCTIVSAVTGFQSCDPVFPIIFDKNGIPQIRGAIYIVDFTK